MLNTKDISIITIEDPIEYAVEDISQIQINPRTGLTFAHGLRSILRQDPNIIMVGEIRDADTASIAVNTALTGHLLLSTLHTNDTSQAVSRILDSFPAANQPQVRQQLSLALLAIVAQQLVPGADKVNRYPAVEIMIANHAVRNLIRRGEDHQIYSAIATGKADGMISMEQSLAEMVRCGRITRETALAHGFRLEDLNRYL